MLSHQDIPILVAKPDDGVSVGKVLSQTQVVIATAGPFAKYGNTVGVGACVELWGADVGD